MNTDSLEDEKNYWRVKFPIDVEISASANMRNLNVGDGVTTNVSIRKPKITFPKKCVYCGAPNDISHPVAIREGKTKKVGSHNRFVNTLVEFKETYPVPFCQKHFKTYKQNQTINIIGFVLGFILFAPMGYIFSPWKLPEDMGGLIVAGIIGGIGSVLVAWVFRKILSMVSERFRTLRDWPWFSIDVDGEIENVSFRFHNKEYEKDFIRLNQSENPIFE